MLFTSDFVTTWSSHMLMSGIEHRSQWWEASTLPRHQLDSLYSFQHTDNLVCWSVLIVNNAHYLKLCLATLLLKLYSKHWCIKTVNKYVCQLLHTPIGFLKNNTLRKVTLSSCVVGWLINKSHGTIRCLVM